MILIVINAVIVLILILILVITAIAGINRIIQVNVLGLQPKDNILLLAEPLGYLSFVRAGSRKPGLGVGGDYHLCHSVVLNRPSLKAESVHSISLTPILGLSNPKPGSRSVAIVRPLCPGGSVPCIPFP